MRSRSNSVTESFSGTSSKMKREKMRQSTRVRSASEEMKSLPFKSYRQACMHLECNSCGLQKLDQFCKCVFNENIKIKVRYFSVVTESISRVQNEIIETEMTSISLWYHFCSTLGPFLWHSWKKKNLLHMIDLTHTKLGHGSLSIKADYAAMGSIVNSININQTIPARYYNFTAIVSFFKQFMTYTGENGQEFIKKIFENHTWFFISPAGGKYQLVPGHHAMEACLDHLISFYKSKGILVDRGSFNLALDGCGKEGKNRFFFQVQAALADKHDLVFRLNTTAKATFKGQHDAEGGKLALFCKKSERIINSKY